MKGKFITSVVFLLVVCFFTGCIIVYNTGGYSEYDIYNLAVRNDSSHTVFYQYFIQSNDEYAPVVFYAHGNTLLINEVDDSTYGLVDKNDFKDIKKILIIDADTRRQLKKIDGDALLGILTEERSVEKKSDATVTRYRYWLTITDEFLGNT
jgi:hypothetical protein